MFLSQKYWFHLLRYVWYCLEVLSLHEAISTSFAAGDKAYLFSPSPISDIRGGSACARLDDFPWDGLEVQVSFSWLLDTLGFVWVIGELWGTMVVQANLGAQHCWNNTKRRKGIKFKVGPIQAKCINGKSLGLVCKMQCVNWWFIREANKSISGLKSSLSRAQINDALSSLHLEALWFLRDSKSAIRFCFPEYVQH